MSFFSLWNKSTDEVIEFFRAFPLESYDLNLDFNGEKPGNVQLKKVFRYLPQHLKSLRVSGGNLYQIPARDLRIIFSHLPKTLSSLSLASNSLLYTKIELSLIYHHLPRELLTLNLYANSLGCKSAGELEEIAAALPPGLTSLDLGANGLHPKQFIRFFSALTKGLRALYLQSQRFGTLQPEELISVFRSFPETLEILDLSLNSLGNMFFEEAVSNYLPKMLTSLKLNFNGLGAVNTQGLINFFSNLPLNLRDLQLSGNRLGEKNIEELCALVRAFPRGLESLDLSNNDFWKKSFKEKRLILSMLPPDLTQLNVSGWDIDCSDKKQLCRLFLSLPKSIKTIVIDKHTFNIDDFWYEQLLGSTSLDSLMFSSVNPPFVIDELRLNQLIAILEHQKTAKAAFLCGLLMEGRIVNTIEPKDCLSEYLIKRTHDAISFYTWASAKESIFRPIMEYFLWEIKLTCESPTLKRRLGEYDLNLARTPLPYQTKFFTEFSSEQLNVNMSFEQPLDISFAIPVM